MAQTKTKSVQSKNKKQQNNNKKGGNFFKRIGRKFKEVGSELKKVTWPKFDTVAKQTGIVLVVVLAFFLVILAFDSLMAYLLQLLVGRNQMFGSSLSFVMSILG